MSYRCIIFDFDGTLANTEQKALAIYNELAQKFEYRPINQEELNRMKKMTFREMLEATEIPLKKIPKVMKMAQKRLKNEMKTIAPFDPELKIHLRDMKSQVALMGILTSNTRRNVRAFLKEQDIQGFDFVLSSPLMGKEKKIRAVIRRWGLDKSDILYVGDETRDIEACKAAQVDCAAVSWGYNYPETLLKEQPTYLVDRFSQLLDIVGK
jgi:phosphoglycolate phosphatase